MIDLILFDAFKYLDILLGFGATVVATWMLFQLSKLLKIGRDNAEGVQKFHVYPTSRLGGIAIFSGLAVSGLGTIAAQQNSLTAEINHYSFWFLVGSLPVWVAGLIEDLTHRVGPTVRLISATLSAALLFNTLGISVNRTDVWLIDLALSLPGVPLCITLLVVAGFTHSVNIVDGFHGLACGLVIIALSSLAIMAWKVDDILILRMCFTSLAVVFGFFVFNWPKGAIFLGDSGAYLIGFWVVELGILLSLRNPQISPMAPVVAGLLPLIETLFSIYRRNVFRDHPVNQPDALHLHTLVYRRLIFNPAVAYLPDRLNVVNACVALFFWIPAAIFAGLACIFSERTDVQLVFMLIYLAMYNWLYLRLVRFNAPAFMRFRKISHQ
jgi:UDP-N-acetylmuramyl pentapeptide phosphotransferase/UDP-N-acetylglucosamine-1-phosphate transferase